MRAMLASLGIGSAALAALAIFAAIDWPGRQYRSGDFFQFWAAGRAILEGGSPYDLERWRALHLVHGGATTAPQPPDGPAWTTPYPMWTLALAAPLALLPLPVAGATWLVAQLVFSGIGLRVLIRGILATDRRRDGFLLVGLMFGSQPFWLLVANGNITGYLFAAASSSLVLWSHGRQRAAGMMAGLFALKPQSLALFGVALLGFGRRPLAFLAGGTLTLILLVALSLAVRPSWVAEWLPNMAALQGSTGSNATIWTIGRVSTLPGAPIIAAVTLAVGYLNWLAARRPAPVIAAAAALPLSLLLSPHGWTYDQLLLVPAIAVALERVSGLPPRTRLPFVLALALSFGPLGWILAMAAVERNGEELAVLVPIAILALVMLGDELARRDERRPSRVSARGEI